MLKTTSQLGYLSLIAAATKNYIILANYLKKLTSEGVGLIFIGIVPCVPGMHLAVFAMLNNEYFFV
jgi:hypothetical protein